VCLGGLVLLYYRVSELFFTACARQAISRLHPLCSVRPSSTFQSGSLLKAVCCPSPAVWLHIIHVCVAVVRVSGRKMLRQHQHHHAHSCSVDCSTHTDRVSCVSF
jgi:hypothetical protein